MFIISTLLACTDSCLQIIEAAQAFGGFGYMGSFDDEGGVDFIAPHGQSEEVELKVVPFSFAICVFINHLLCYLRAWLPVQYHKVPPTHVPFCHIMPCLRKSIWHAFPRQTIILSGTFSGLKQRILVLTYQHLSPSLLSAVQKFQICVRLDSQ